MSDYGTQPFRGRVERPKPWLEQGPQGPLNAKVTVTALELNGYARVQHEIRLTWVGPVKLSGTPDITNQSGITAASDVHLVEDLELARHVASQAYGAAIVGRIRPLKELAENLEKLWP